MTPTLVTFLRNNPRAKALGLFLRNVPRARVISNTNSPWKVAQIMAFDVPEVFIYRFATQEAQKALF